MERREASTLCIPEEKVLVRISQNSQENTCVGVSLNKTEGLWLVTLLKKRLRHSFFRVNLAKFLATSYLQNISG